MEAAALSVACTRLGQKWDGFFEQQDEDEEDTESEAERSDAPPAARKGRKKRSIISKLFHPTYTSAPKQVGMMEQEAVHRFLWERDALQGLGMLSISPFYSKDEQEHLLPLLEPLIRNRGSPHTCMDVVLHMDVAMGRAVQDMRVKVFAAGRGAGARDRFPSAHFCGANAERTNFDSGRQEVGHHYSGDTRCIPPHPPQSRCTSHPH